MREKKKEKREKKKIIKAPSPHINPMGRA